MPPGIYSFECWGAAGKEFFDSNVGYYKANGKGSYVFGKLRIDYFQKFYVYVGQKGLIEPEAPIFGGGGYSDYSGGGATDIRLEIADENNDFPSLKSRIFVAAGGAGADAGSEGGSGGDLKGLDSSGGSKGATQTSPGTGFVNGSFGHGGGNRDSDDNNGGGGGGYYGGGSGSIQYNHGGSGGSSFISGYSGCDAISKDSTNDAIKHTGKPWHYSGFIFYDGVMINGDSKMPGVSTETEIGHNNSGYARITLLSKTVIPLITCKIHINLHHFVCYALISLFFS